jgi:hypothetical protein
MRKPWFRNRIDHAPAVGDLQDAIGRAETAPPAPVRLGVGSRVTAVTDAGQTVEGAVGRIYQTPADYRAGVFRFACEPAGDDSSSDEGRAS